MNNIHCRTPIHFYNGCSLLIAGLLVCSPLYAQQETGQKQLHISQQQLNQILLTREADQALETAFDMGDELF